MTSAHLPDKKKIAKNTLALYARMMLVIAVGLYTSRVVLQTLGEDDYGVYNVVGGIVVMIGFLNSALTAASQRFISYELGTGRMERLKRVFSTAVSIHVVLAIIIFALAETIGLWFLNTHLNIAAARMEAANWVFHCSVLTLMVSIVSVPYNSCIVAHEHMKAFAFIGILEVALKLAIVYLLLVIQHDKLVTYALLVLCVSLVIRLVFGIYCKRHFEECSYRLTLDRKLFKDMFAFAGWSVVGNFGFSFKDQGSNIIVNLFFGTAVNAARGIAMQVNGVISHFSSNFTMALAPQITKQYAAGNVQESMKLVYLGCRLSFYLMAMIAVPVLVNVDYLLTLWLGFVPRYTSEFLSLCLLAGMVNAMVNPVTTALQATGKIALFQVVVCVVVLCELPFAYILLKLGFKPYAAMWPTVIMAMVALLIRVWLLKRQVPAYSLRYFTFSVFGKNMLLATVAIALSVWIRARMGHDFLSFAGSSVLACAIVCAIFYALGLTRRERTKNKKKIMSRIQRH